MSKNNNRAQAKARLLTLAMRAASDAEISAQAQALLATVIAEAWVDGTRWTARLGMQVLGERLGCTRDTVRRWTDELERSQLVRRRIGNNGRVTRWTLPDFEKRGAGAAVGTRQRSGSAAPAPHNPLRQRRTDSDARCTSGLDADRSTGSIAAEPEPTPRPSSGRDDALPRFGPLLEASARRGFEHSIRLVRQLAERGDDDARALLEELDQVEPADASTTAESVA